MRVQRPAAGDGKILILIPISPRVLARLRRAAAKRHKSLQRYIHYLLEKAVSNR
jgi:hypothetical protein